MTRRNFFGRAFTAVLTLPILSKLAVTKEVKPFTMTDWFKSDRNGEWKHFAICYDGKIEKMYINGQGHSEVMANYQKELA